MDAARIGGHQCGWVRCRSRLVVASVSASVNGREFGAVAPQSPGDHDGDHIG
jgi:hypothetical protein